jgi:hypothetical protein
VGSTHALLLRVAATVFVLLAYVCMNLLRGGWLQVAVVTAYSGTALCSFGRETALSFIGYTDALMGATRPYL